MRRVGIAITLLAIVTLSLVLVSRVNATGTALGAISAVESGTSNVSSWVVGPDPDSPINSTIYLDLFVSGSSGVWSLKTGINWTSNVINLTSVSEGTFLKKNPTSSTLFVGGSSLTWYIDSAGNGYISGGISDTRLTKTATLNADGVLATLAFNVTGYGVGNVTLSNGVLSDINDATSTPTLNSATITVTDIMPAPAPVGNIEVFTDRGGVGENTNSSVYGPQDLVNMYANVSYGDAPVANIEVSFNVFYPNGTLFTLNTAQSNSTGYAYTSCRLPWPDNSNPESLFGNWSITAVAEVSQTTVNATINFVYNYVVNINGIQLPAGIQRQTTATVNVTILSVENSPVWSTVVVTVYDQLEVPIGSYIAYNGNVTTGNTIVSVAITIPSWASVGQATVYVDVLTNLPNASSTPYCPEEVANFQIPP